MNRPSADQEGIVLSGGPCVTCRRLLPATSIIQTSRWPLVSSESNTMCLPSRDQFGYPCASPGPCVRGNAFEPSAFDNQISPGPPRDDPNAMRSAAAENCGCSSAYADWINGAEDPSGRRM